MDKWDKNYHRYEALKYDVENGVRLSKHKSEEFEKLKKYFEM